MKKFEYYNPVQVKFGKGVRKEVGATLSQHYSKVLLVCSVGPFHENGLYDEIKTNLEDAGITVFTMSDVEPNPKLYRIREGVEACKQNGVELILGVGSGSAIDCSKAISAAAAMDVDPYDLYWGERIKVTKTIDTSFIPTFASTGSEMNMSSVAVKENPDGTKEKMSFDSAHAKYVFMDPEVTLTVPWRLTIGGIMDILSHTYELYFNGDMDSEFQMHLSEGIISAVMKATDTLVKDPMDIVAHGELMWAAAVTWGTGLTWIGRGPMDMACHGIEESFSAYFDTHHGSCLGILTPRWMEIVAPRRPKLFARFARNVMGIQEADDMTAALAGVAKYKEWMKSVNAPIVFSDLVPKGSPIEFRDEELQIVAKTACKVYGGAVGKMEKFDEEGIMEILRNGKIPY